MPTAITHEPIFNTPVSSTNTAVVRWSGTTGATIVDSGVLIDGSNNITGVAGLTATQVDITGQGDLRLQDTTGGQYVALQAAGTTTSHTLTLPATQGSASTVLTNDGAGALTWAAAGISSTVESFTRTASAGAGTQALTGAGFAPKAAIIYAGDGGAGAAWGFVDDSDGGRNIYHNAQNGSMTTTIFSLSASHAINVRNNSSASDQMYASAALTSNGLTFTWSKSNSGVDVTGYILYLG